MSVTEHEMVRKFIELKLGKALSIHGDMNLKVDGLTYSDQIANVTRLVELELLREISDWLGAIQGTLARIDDDLVNISTHMMRGRS